MAKSIIFFALMFMLSSASAQSQENHWYKGNTHTHTNRSDGDSIPETVAKWYKDHGYNFLVITDHDTLTPASEIYGLCDSSFILIPGEEVSELHGKIPVHLNGINIKELVVPRGGRSVDEILWNDNVAIREAGGISQINHPNWKWAFNDREISLLLKKKPQNYLMEIYNCNKDTNNFGGGGRPGTEEIWDRLLGLGMVVYGIVSDDSHRFSGEYDPNKAFPGRGWVMVKAPSLGAEEITRALYNGNFYATTGIAIDDIVITDRDYTIAIKPHREFIFTTHFIGEGGKIVKTDYNERAVYTFTGKESYVRAKIICSSGDIAITQPAFLQKLRKENQGQCP